MGYCLIWVKGRRISLGYEKKPRALLGANLAILNLDLSNSHENR